MLSYGEHFLNVKKLNALVFLLSLLCIFFLKDKH